MKRQLTRKEEEVIRLCHHEFKGLSVSQTARVMCVSPAYVGKLLQSAKKKAPQLFPILTSRQLAVLQGCENNASQETIAAGLGVTVMAVKRVTTFLYKHKFLENKPKVIAYSPLMDNKIVEKF